ncbi:hypothetical protein NLG97_g8661 [Lecanicillium saksenae]|uniref:Uncharacterized protein n=1 Tax=Lecanicillium saksenae TaxID=468837 RepID=A0ACC1QKM9_9HYPO|nr:hypothetical protein NLG97_g8661 [Lecanicillium saksenae]
MTPSDADVPLEMFPGNYNGPRQRDVGVPIFPTGSRTASMRAPAAPIRCARSKGIPACDASVSIDGTIRTWPLAQAALDDTVKKIREEAEKAAAGKTDEAKEDAGEGMLTAEEEAELAELMDD